jgi:hypothetical protein
MSFRADAAAMCLDGRKTMTRRIWKDGYQRRGRIDTDKPIGTRPIGFDPCNQIVSKPWTDRRLVLWTVGETIAIKPSRTAPAVGRVVCTGLRVERVQEITEEDARAEGVECDCLARCIHTARDAFEATWRRLYPRGPQSWDANPFVVVIGFCPMAQDQGAK